MKIHKRAIKSIIRQPAKSIILYSLVLILSVFMVGAIITNNAINNTENRIRRNMQPILTIEFNENLFQNYLDELTYSNVDFDINMVERPTLSSEIVREIGQSTEISFYNYMVESHIRSNQLKQFCFNDWNMSWFRVRGLAQGAMVEFETEVLKLVAGRSFSESDFLYQNTYVPAIINDKVTEINGLSIGSSFTMHQYYDRLQQRRVGLSFEVIGIFSDPEEDFIPGLNIWDDRVTIDNAIREFNINTIYMPSWAIEDIKSRLMENLIRTYGENIPSFLIPLPLSILPIFVLEDPLLMSQFVNSNKPLLPEFFYFVDVYNTFETIAPSLQTIRNISHAILVATVVSTALIITLLISLFLRDRRKEIGIYLAVGESKIKIIGQVLFEILLISSIAITCSFMIGNIVANEISVELLRNELDFNSGERVPSGVTFYEGGGLSINLNEMSLFDRYRVPQSELSMYEVMELFDVSITPNIIILSISVGLSVITIATCLPLIFSLKKDPKKLLL